MLRLCIFTVCLTVLISKIFAQGGVCNHQCVSSGTCNWKHFQDKCYYLFKDNTRTWSESKSLCQRENLDVGQLHKGFQTKDLFNGLHYGVAAWQGGEIKNLDQLEYVNGEPFTQRTAQRDDRKCGTVKKNWDHQIVFGVKDCKRNHYFICRFGQDNITVSLKKKTWFEAHSTCVDQGGDLFYLNQGEDDNQILKVAIIDSYHNKDIYIGVKNFKWQWPDSSEIRHYNWDSRESENRNEDCIAVYSYGNKWHDWPCSNENYVVCQKGCRFELTESWGNFSSPNYPSEYPLNTTCEWLITVPEGRKVHLLFLDFHVANDGKTCSFDSVKVYDGLPEKAPLLPEYCGATSPAPLSSTGNSLKVIFKSEFLRGYSGFQAVYYSTEISCGNPEIPANAYLESFTGAAHLKKSAVKILCKNGYRLHGDSERTCQTNGGWSGTPPYCSAILCNTLLAPANGTVAYTMDYAYPEHGHLHGKILYGHKAIFTCDEGFTLNGSAILTCIGNEGPEGRFDGQPPSCDWLAEIATRTLTQSKSEFPHTVIPWILLAISLLIIGGLVAYIIISKRQKKNDDPVEMCDNTYYDSSSGAVTFTPAAGVTGNTDGNQAMTSGNNAADDMEIVDNEYYDSFEASGGAMAQSSGQKPAFKVGPRTGDIYSQVQKEGDEKLYANI